MKFLIDMNLSPRWCAILRVEGWDSVHWSNVGRASAPDSLVAAVWEPARRRCILIVDEAKSAPSIVAAGEEVRTLARSL